MEKKTEGTLRKLFLAGVGALDLGAEKLGEWVDRCAEQGEKTVARGRALNEELRRTVKEAAEKPAQAPVIDPEKLTAEQRRELLEKLQALEKQEH